MKSATSLVAGSLIALGALGPIAARAQGSATTPPSSQALAGALAQIRAQNLDSATVLLRLIATAPTADSSERAVAYMWLGVATYYKGQDSVATSHFRSALEINPVLTAAALLAKLDSGMAVSWENEQTRALCGETIPAWIQTAAPSAALDPLNASARAAQGPKLTAAPPFAYPENLREANVQGRVVVRAIIDSAGHAEPGSVRIVSSPNSGFNETVTGAIQNASFTPQISRGARTRACVVLPVDFTITR